MELRIDRLLKRFRANPELVLKAIDDDPSLVKREVGELVLANASKELFTPREEHQLFAKGIIYQRNPYRLVSLPLLKIYNLGEREVTVEELSKLSQEGANIAFLRKVDGSMIQRFQHANRVWFSTRGMLDGFFLPNPDEETHFDYLAAARQIAGSKYPELLKPKPEWENLTFVMELIHPEGRVITNYGNREDLILLTVFDCREFRYWNHRITHDFAAKHGINHTEILKVKDGNLGVQINHMLQMIAGTDEEGSVINFETDEVIYRVKVKSPDYLRLLRLMVDCTYSSTVEMLQSFLEFPIWEHFEAILKEKGSEKVPEEVLAVYREHYDKICLVRRSCEKIRDSVQERANIIWHDIDEKDAKAKRKRFATLIASEPLKSLWFLAVDQRLTLDRVLAHFSDHEDAIHTSEALN